MADVKHTPGPSMSHHEAMTIAVLLTLEVRKLRETGRSCFTEQANQLEALERRFMEWMSKPATAACQGCAGTGFYAPTELGRDACVDCDGAGQVPATAQTAMAAAMTKTIGGAARATEGSV